jgi:creatinine deaminase
MTMADNASHDDLRFMRMAYEQAEKSFHEENGIPVGAVLAVGDRHLASGHNNRNQKESRILHGEMDCLHNFGLKPLPNPCAMCAGAIIQFGITRVVIGQERITEPPEAVFVGRADELAKAGIEIIMLHDPDCQRLFAEFLASPSGLRYWLADIGQ